MMVVIIDGGNQSEIQSSIEQQSVFFRNSEL
jgi:hypothetical protein